MKLAVPLLLILTGCPDSGGSGNAAVLWLAPDMSETRVKLIEAEPPPY